MTPDTQTAEVVARLRSTTKVVVFSDGEEVETNKGHQDLWHERLEAADLIESLQSTLAEKDALAGKWLAVEPYLLEADRRYHEAMDMGDTLTARQMYPYIANALRAAALAPCPPTPESG